MASPRIGAQLRAMPMHRWLMKTEPDVFSIETLRKLGTAPWDGVRNFQARNYMRAMRLGDQVLIYHSSTKPPGVAGLATVAREAHPDTTAWDPKSEYFDAASTPEKPRWDLVDVHYQRTFPRYVSLDDMRAVPELSDMLLFKRSRLSVQPVDAACFKRIVTLASKGR